MSTRRSIGAPSEIRWRSYSRVKVKSLFSISPVTDMSRRPAGICAQASAGMVTTACLWARVLQFANQSKAANRVVVLDSCHSGVAGGKPIQQQYAELSDGLTILTARTVNQYATEKNGSGIFTALFVDALDGSVGDLVGNVTPGSVYAHIDQSLGNGSSGRHSRQMLLGSCR